jgi:hypothetical protein
MELNRNGSRATSSKNRGGSRSTSSASIPTDYRVNHFQKGVATFNSGVSTPAVAWFRGEPAQKHAGHEISGQLLPGRSWKE